MRTPRDPHAATSHISRATSAVVRRQKATLFLRLRAAIVNFGVAVIARNIRGQYFSSLGTAGIGPDTIDECARPLASGEAIDMYPYCTIFPALIFCG